MQRVAVMARQMAVAMARRAVVVWMVELTAEESWARHEREGMGRTMVGARVRRKAVVTETARAAARVGHMVQGMATVRLGVGLRVVAPVAMKVALKVAEMAEMAVVDSAGAVLVAGAGARAAGKCNRRYRLWHGTHSWPLLNPCNHCGDSDNDPRTT